MPEGPDSTRSEGTGSTFEHFLECVPDAILGVGSDGKIVLVNRQAEVIFGYERGELIGETLETLVPKRFRLAHTDRRHGFFEAPRARPMGGGVALFALRRDGAEFPIEVSLSHLELDGETIATAAVRDISERAENEHERALQDELQRARRLESVGQLAGGIAHDFNNILGVIMNYAEFVADELEPDSRAHGDIEEIRRAAERAAALTRQLLIFSRRETVKPEVLDLIALIGELENLLHRALGERVELDVLLDEKLWAIEADPGQVEQVLVNLSVNARDAMPDGGRLLIEADNAELDDEFAYMHPDTAPGRYVRLKVSDTGVGMDTETADRAFEPFFTTKPDGTGLGLATVYGIVTGAGGRLDVYSEPGIGTTVKVHLPATAVVPAPSPPPRSARSAGHGEVVLVVEDEPFVRRMAERILAKGGYAVIGTARGSEAMEICGRREQKIDLLLTDVVMPEMLGTELVERARELRPDLRVVYMSGYSHEVLAPQALTESEHCDFIEKPFNARTLLKAVGDLLEPPGAVAG